MPTRVLYHCPCSSDHTSSFGPCQPSSSSFQLQSLYFCEDCDSIRCDQCTTKDLTVFYCPNCLFDVPLASIKSEHANCPRNCFSCPICTSTLGVVGSDCQEQNHWDPLSAEASLGEPPWYLQCPTCKWDSKEINLTFEKSTGLSLQVQRMEDESADVIEFNHLRSHFDKYLRVSASGGSDTNQFGGIDSAGAAAVRSSKLLRDVPSLLNQPGFSSNRNRNTKKKIDQDENIPQYSAAMTWDAGRDVRRYVGVKQDLQDGKALGAIGRKEQNRLEFLENQTQENGITNLVQRWSALNDQSVKQSDLGPCRVPLRTKQTKRCSVCRHIIIRPESKPTSSKFKIRLLALNRLPEIFIRPPNPNSSLSGGSSADERRRSTFNTLNKRRNIQVDEENLQPGRTYLFEASFLNPLDEMMIVRLHIARPPATSFNDQNIPPTNKQVTPTKNLPTSSSNSSSKYAWSVSPTSSQFPVSAYNEVWELAEEEDDDLFEPNSNKSRKSESAGFGISDDELDELDEDGETGLGDDRGDQKRIRTDVGGHREGKRKGQGIIRRKGHETVIGLELSLDREATGEIEFPMQVTFTYKPDSDVQQSSRGATNSRETASKSFSFWTFVRLGRINSGLSHSSIPSHHSQSHSTEARRSALDKRRSIMGMNLSGQTSSILHHRPSLSGQPTSPLSSLKEAAFTAEMNAAAARGSPQRPSEKARENESLDL